MIVVLTSVMIGFWLVVEENRVASCLIVLGVALVFVLSMVVEVIV